MFSHTTRKYNSIMSYGIIVILVVFISNLSFSQPEKNKPVQFIASTTSSVSLSDLLQLLEKEYDLSFLYETNITKHKYVEISSLPEKGFGKDFFDELSRQTGLIFHQIAVNIYVLKENENAKGWIIGSVKNKKKDLLVGASIYIEDTEQGTITELNGRYELKVKPGTYNFIASYTGYSAIKKTLTVQSNQKLNLDFELVDNLQLEEVVVLGSRSLPRTEMEMAVPVDVINEEDMQFIHPSDLSQLLQYTTPSFHSTRQTISDGTDHTDPATLRGLGPDQLLVLVNGKRRHTSSLVNVNNTIGKGNVGTDLNAIPINAIKKIEVLRDGASAQYGSDAIAGVINIILKDNQDYGSINLTSGMTVEGDGKETNLNGNYGWRLAKDGFANINFVINTRGAINRSGAYTGPIYGDDRDNDNVQRELFFQQTGFDNKRVMSVGNSEANTFGGFFNSSLPFSNDLSFYTNGGLNFRQGKAAGFYRFPFDERKQAGIFENGFSPKILTNIIDFSVTFGFKGEMKDWLFDISNSSGQNKYDFHIENSNNASLGLNSPTTSNPGGFSYRQNTTNLDLSRKLTTKIPINLAFGAEFRLENYKQLAGDEWSWQNYGELTASGEPKEAGIQVFPGFRPENVVDKYRYNIGFYADGEINITKKVLVGLATRYEEYSDFGSNLSWKLSFRNRINDKLTIRGAYNTGFRAPSMPQIYFSSNSFQYIPGEEGLIGIQVAQFNNESIITNRFGIDPLKAELSSNLSLGLTAKPTKNISLSIDAYQINIKDRIVLSGRFSATDDERFAEILDPLDITRAQFFTNAVNTKTTGLDFVFKYNTKLAIGNLFFTLAANANQTKVVGDIHSSDLLTGYEDVLFNREEISRLEVAQPKSKLIVSLAYMKNKLSFNLRVKRFGKVQYIHPSDGDEERWIENSLTGIKTSRDQLFSSKILTDLECSYLVSKNLKCSLGGNNIFNIYPDKHTHSANISNGLFPYSRFVQQFGVRGSYWFAKLSLAI